MPKWDKYIDDEATPSFEKFDSSLKIGRRTLKDRNDDAVKKQRERERDEKRIADRGDEV